MKRKPPFRHVPDMFQRINHKVEHDDAGFRATIKKFHDGEFQRSAEWVGHNAAV